jgi:DNA recombination protein RmuC
MLEYIVIGVLVVVLAVLIYQKLGSKNEISLSDIKERLGIIENAQKSIETLNEKIIDFENIFNNKTKRGKLGEEYLEDIIKDTLIEKHYKFQHTLTNNKRVDCLLKFGSTNENICIDSKFVWDSYEKYFQENDEDKRKQFLKKFEKDLNNHIEAISEKYIVTGETAPLAIMFIASEGVFRAIEDISEDFIKIARKKNVIITSPSTLWSFLRTYKLLIQNREMYEQTHVIQKEVSELSLIIQAFEKGFKDLESRHNKNSETIEDIKTSVSKITKTSEKIQNLDLDDKKIGEQK